MAQPSPEMIDAFSALRAQYLARLTETVASFKELLSAVKNGDQDESARKELLPLVHKLVGSAGTYGYADISKQAVATESALRQSSGSENILRIVTELTKLLRKINDVVGHPQQVEKKTPAGPKEVAPAPAPKPDLKRRIVIAEDDPVISKILETLLAGEFEVIIVADGDEVIDACKEHQPSLIILDNDLPGQTGIDLVGIARETPGIQTTPILMLTGNQDPQNILKAIESGATDYFTKPFEPITFVSHIRSLVTRSELSILLVDDDESVRDILRYQLEAQGFSISEATNGHEALERLAEHVPHLILLDRMMPGLDGTAVLQEVRNHPEWKSAKVIVLTARNAQADAAEWLKRGATDFMTKPFDPDEVVIRACRVLGVEELGS